MPTEISVIVESLFKVVNILIVVFLEKQVRKNSSNSGLPPSQDFSRQGNRNKKASGSQKKGSRLDNSKDTNSEETVSPSECSQCGMFLKTAEVKSLEKRKKIDIFASSKESVGSREEPYFL